MKVMQLVKALLSLGEDYGSLVNGEGSGEEMLCGRVGLMNARFTNGIAK